MVNGERSRNPGARLLDWAVKEKRSAASVKTAVASLILMEMLYFLKILRAIAV
jgi:hypothetical protein